MLQRGDVLVEIDGHSLQGITHESATQLLRQVRSCHEKRVVTPHHTPLQPAMACHLLSRSLQASGEINLKVLRKTRRGPSSDSLTTTPAETAAASPVPPSSPKLGQSPEPVVSATASVAKSLSPLAEDASVTTDASTAVSLYSRLGTCLLSHCLVCSRLPPLPPVLLQTRLQSSEPSDCNGCRSDAKLSVLRNRKTSCQS